MFGRNKTGKHGGIIGRLAWCWLGGEARPTGVRRRLVRVDPASGASQASQSGTRSSVTNINTTPSLCWFPSITPALPPCNYADYDSCCQPPRLAVFIFLFRRHPLPRSNNADCPAVRARCYRWRQAAWAAFRARGVAVGASTVPTSPTTVACSRVWSAMCQRPPSWARYVCFSHFRVTLRLCIYTCR